MFAHGFTLVLGLAVACALAIPIPQAAPHLNNLVVRQPGSGNHHATATWFKQNGVAGACGTVHKDSDHVVALQTIEYDNGAHCGKTISITDSSSGVTTTGVIADECPGCGPRYCQRGVEVCLDGIVVNT